MPEIILSITMPTLNQPLKVRRALESLRGELTPEVEIVIRDDSPNNDTAAVVHEFDDLPIRYVHGKKEGVDPAIIFLTEEARGKYVWWLGDDEVSDSAVSKLLSLFKKHPEIDFVYVNSGSYENPDLRSVNLGPSRFFKDREEVLVRIADLLGFCSATICRRGLAIAALPEAREKIGTAWVPLFISLSALSKGKNFYFLDGRNFVSDPKPPNQATWYDQFQVFALNLFDIVSGFKKYFPAGVIRTMLKKNFSGVWRGMLYYRAMGYTNGLGGPEATARRLWSRYKTFPEFWIAAPLLLLPRAVIGLLYRVYKKIFPKTRERLA